MTRIHVSLRTADLTAATAFYTRLFGEGPDKVRDGYVRFSPASAPILLSLMPGEPALDHLGVRLGTAVEAKARWAQLAADGADVSSAEGVVCCHAEKSEAWFTDPDGRGWEVYAVTDEAPTAGPTDRVCCA